MRAFLGIPVPDDVKDKLFTLTEDLKGDYRGSWVKKDNYHITILFLGEIRKEFADDYSYQIEKVLDSTPPFDVALSGFSCFPSKKRPRVLFAGLSEGYEMCRSVYLQAAAVLPEKMQPENHKFRAHVTLARFNRHQPVIHDEVWRRNFMLTYKADSCVLYRSVLEREGAVYTPVSVINFNGAL